MDEILDHITNNNLAIVLINAYHVRCLSQSATDMKTIKKKVTLI